MKHEDAYAYLKDQQFEFAASRYIFIYLCIIVLFCYFNKPLNFIRRAIVFVDSVHLERIQIGIGKKNPVELIPYPWGYLERNP